MLDLGLSFALATLLASRRAGTEQGRAAVRKLGDAGIRERERANKLEAAIERGNEKLEVMKRALVAERKRKGAGTAELQKLVRDLRTTVPKLGDVLDAAAGLVKDETGRWRIVRKRHAPTTPTKPEHKPERERERKPEREHKPKTTGRAPAKAARDLKAFLATPGSNWGWSGTPSPTIKLAQHDMGQLTPDGKMGPRTRARARELGTELPYRTADKPTTTRTPTKAPARAPERKPERERKRKPKRTGRGAARAARDLKAFLATPGSNWGWSGTPSPTIEVAQHDMGGLTPDGKMGPRTRARARELGVELPYSQKTPTSTPTPTRASTSTPTASTAPRSPAEAARAMRDYLARPGANWGWQGASSPMLFGYQSEMGGLTPDGKMGPKTRARARELGVMLPSGPVK